MSSDHHSSVALLYDADCGFCNWCVAKILAWDRHKRLRPVALQTPEADELLAGTDHESKMASWHLVDEGGHVYSAGAAVAPLMDMLAGGRPLAALARRFPRSAERSYRLGAGNRDVFGRLIGQRARQRAARRIAERAAG